MRTTGYRLHNGVLCTTPGAHPTTQSFAVSGPSDPATKRAAEWALDFARKDLGLPSLGMLWFEKADPDAFAPGCTVGAAEDIIRLDAGLSPDEVAAVVLHESKHAHINDQFIHDHISSYPDDDERERDHLLFEETYGRWLAQQRREEDTRADSV